jgi:hypothetical protein
VRDLATSADLVDAAVCVLAGADFISARARNEPRGSHPRRARGLDLDGGADQLTAPIRMLVIPYSKRITRTILLS